MWSVVCCAATWSLYRDRLRPLTCCQTIGSQGYKQGERPKIKNIHFWIGPPRWTAMLCNATEGHVGMCGLHCCTRPDEAWDSCGCMQSMALPDALAMFSGFTTQGDILTWVECVATLEHVEVHGPEGHEWLGTDMGKGHFDVFGFYYHQSLQACPWYFYVICYLLMAWESLASPSSQVTVDGFWPGCRQKETNCHPPPLQEQENWPLWMWPCPLSIWTIKMGLFFSLVFSFFSLSSFLCWGRGSHKGQRWMREDWEVPVIGMHDVKIPNNQ